MESACGFSGLMVAFVALGAMTACAPAPAPRSDADVVDASTADADRCAPTAMPGFNECSGYVAWGFDCWPAGLRPDGQPLEEAACARWCPSLEGSGPLTCTTGGGHGELHLYCARCP